MMRESETVGLLPTDVTLEEEKPHLIAWNEERRNQNTKVLYSTYSKQYLESTTLRGFDPKSDISLASFMRASLERGLSRSTINSSVASSAADMYRYDDVPMGRGALITQLKKVVSESTPIPSQKKPIEMEHIRRMDVLVKPCFVHVRDFHMILLMAVCMMRESEAVALLATDVTLDMIGGSWSLYVVKVQKSKTD
jgi:site-specific recombinase XerC